MALTRPPGPTVRPLSGVAGPTTIETTYDADLLADVHAETVRFAYAGFFPTSPPPTVEEVRTTWTERLSDPTATAFVACRDGQALGTVLIRADPDFADEGQVVGLHVRPAHWARGVGSALHDHALAALMRGGYRHAGLWVIAENERARAMYESRGWSIVPAVVLHVYGVTEVRYRAKVVSKAPFAT